MVVGKDANPSPFLKIAAKLGLTGHEAHQRGFTVTIGSGETWDLLLSADDKRPIYRNYIDRFFPQFYPMHNHDDYKVTKIRSRLCPYNHKGVFP